MVVVVVARGLIERQEQALEISAARNLLKMGGMGAGAGFAVATRLRNPSNVYGAVVVVLVVVVEVETSLENVRMSSFVMVLSEKLCLVNVSGAQYV